MDFACQSNGTNVNFACIDNHTFTQFFVLHSFFSHRRLLLNPWLSELFGNLSIGNHDLKETKMLTQKFHKNVKHKAPIETLNIAEHPSRFPGIVAWSLALAVVVACTGALQLHFYRLEIGRLTIWPFL